MKNENSVFLSEEELVSSQAVKSLSSCVLVKSQLKDILKIQQNIDIGHLNDTSFRERLHDLGKIVESMLSDYLLDESHWRKKINA